MRGRGLKRSFSRSIHQPEKMPEDYYGSFRKNDKEPCFGYMKGLLPIVYAHREGLVI